MKNLLEFFNRSTKFKHSTEIPSCLYVNNTPLSDLKALGSGIFKPAITKAGRLSLQGRMPDNQKVKIYSCFSPAQTNLRLRLDSLNVEQTLYFPRLVLYDDFLLVEEWINGIPLNELPHDEAMQYVPHIESFLTQVQHDHIFINLADKNAEAFCYLNDYLLKRLGVWSQWQPVKELILEWKETESKVVDILPNFLSHPDLSMSNLIVQHSTGKLYVVDNELLGVGRSWVIDGKNSFCKSKFKDDLVDAVSQNFANLSWKLRLVGSALDNGDFERAERLAQIK